MKFILALILLSILVSGCTRPDEKMRRQIIGSWNGGSMTFEADGSFHCKFTGPKWTQEQYGTWFVRDGFLDMTVTNSTAVNEPVVLPIGHVSHCKILSIDANSFTYSNTKETETFTQTR
jgi:hypothetical protein